MEASAFIGWKVRSAAVMKPMNWPSVTSPVTPRQPP